LDAIISNFLLKLGAEINAISFPRQQPCSKDVFFRVCYLAANVNLVKFLFATLQQM
jgi:hypothetical protein